MKFAVAWVPSFPLTPSAQTLTALRRRLSGQLLQRPTLILTCLPTTAPTSSCGSCCAVPSAWSVLRSSQALRLQSMHSRMFSAMCVRNVDVQAGGFPISRSNALPAATLHTLSTPAVRPARVLPAVADRQYGHDVPTQGAIHSSLVACGGTARMATCGTACGGEACPLPKRTQGTRPGCCLDCQILHERTRRTVSARCVPRGKVPV